MEIGEILLRNDGTEGVEPLSERAVKETKVIRAHVAQGTRVIVTGNVEPLDSDTLPSEDLELKPLMLADDSE